MDYEFLPGLAALAGIIPLVIVYLLKPRPKQVILPSLMFVRKVVRETSDSRRKMSKRITDPLFFLQLIALILMAIAIAGPLIENIEEDSEKVVVIIDSSASMSVPDRINEAKFIAMESLGKENTVIAAESMPLVLAKAVEATDAREVINSLEAGGTPGGLPEAILTVINDEGNRKAKVAVVSDFENWAGRPPETYARIARAKNLELEFMQVGRETPNYAIIDGYLKDRNDGTYEYTCTVKNFNNKSVKLDLWLESKSGLLTTRSISKPVSLGEFGTQQIKFSSIPQGTSTVEILNKDAVPCDNIARISIPEIKPRQMLMLTDIDPEIYKSPLITALSLIPGLTVDVQHALPADTGKYDSIVINCEHEPLAASTIKEVIAHAGSGKNIIVIGNGCLYNSSGMRELYPILPVEIRSIEEDNSHTLETAGSGTQLFEGISFDEVHIRKYLVAVPRENASVLAELKDAGPVVCTWKPDNGTITYVGISDIAGNEAWNNFPTVPAYPVFWAKLLKYLWGIGDIRETNVNTGRYQAFDRNIMIENPKETISSKSVYYDKCGFYNLDQKTIAANLYDSTESNTFTENRLNLTGGREDVQKEDLHKKSPDRLREYLIYSLLLLLILENLIMFRRKII
ncbi:hypothetical protein EQO05_00560 [Methanosarcina sp. MSH10X1]|uniref:vWA domain-containing protein n=1 Tax=Methanosarcina sp. MSH10X1 TaxID=2507075 RepID=UPI000FFB700E|nr:VWA domain-containing protein [Methanosarcina sp. MSH10X1]RXA21771.1 hypothetical protein EQO05_00560 [Methanosarcina sp. MSH10X1]